MNGSGGLHIHNGISCATPAEVGKHLWHYEDGGTDPWKVAKYTVSGGSNFFQYKAHGDVTVECDLAILEVVNHTVVVHDPNGVKIGCGVLKESASIRQALVRPSIVVGLIVLVLSMIKSE